jgi:hypothetical protein
VPVVWAGDFNFLNGGCGRSCHGSSLLQNGSILPFLNRCALKYLYTYLVYFYDTINISAISDVLKFLPGVYLFQDRSRHKKTPLHCRGVLLAQADELSE